MPSGKKPPADPARAAKSILDQVTGTTPKVTPEKNAAAAEDAASDLSGGQKPPPRKVQQSGWRGG